MTGTVNINVNDSIATKRGTNLFGGLLDRCLPSPFAEVYIVQTTQEAYSGLGYIENISNIKEGSIASLAVRVCFCNTKGEPDCTYQPTPIYVKKSETFTVSLVAVDQVRDTVEVNILSSLLLT